MSWTITPAWYDATDVDAVAYIAAVNAADAANGQSGGLEIGVRLAIDKFVVGCKADGIWNAIKASCILAGARTRQGALVPLVNASGVAPTFNGTAGGWSYNRKTSGGDIIGLAGNGTDNYINSGRNNNADPQDNFHMSAWASATGTGGFYFGSNLLTGGASAILNDTANTRDRWGSRGDSSNLTSNTHNIAGFKGQARASGSTFSVRTNGATVTPTGGSLISQVPEPGRIYVFARNSASGSGSPSGLLTSTGRIAFYSIGENLNLALLDARVDALLTAFATGIA